MIKNKILKMKDNKVEGKILRAKLLELTQMQSQFLLIQS